MLALVAGACPGVGAAELVAPSPAMTTRDRRRDPRLAHRSGAHPGRDGHGVRGRVPGSWAAAAARCASALARLTGARARRVSIRYGGRGAGEVSARRAEAPLDRARASVPARQRDGFSRRRSLPNWNTALQRVAASVARMGQGESQSHGAHGSGGGILPRAADLVCARHSRCAFGVLEALACTESKRPDRVPDVSSGEVARQVVTGSFRAPTGDAGVRTTAPREGRGRVAAARARRAASMRARLP